MAPEPSKKMVEGDENEASDRLDKAREVNPSEQKGMEGGDKKGGFERPTVDNDEDKEA